MVEKYEIKLVCDAQCKNTLPPDQFRQFPNYLLTFRRYHNIL
jgi:hypothetical protein